MVWLELYRFPLLPTQVFSKSAFWPPPLCPLHDFAFSFTQYSLILFRICLKNGAFILTTEKG